MEFSFKLVLPSIHSYFFPLSRASWFHPPMERAETLFIFVSLKAPFYFPLFIIQVFLQVFCFSIYKIRHSKWKLVCLPQNKTLWLIFGKGMFRILPSFVKHPRMKNKKIMKILIFFSFLLRETTKFSVVNLVDSLVGFRGCLLSLHNSRPILDDTFSPLWCLIVQRKCEWRWMIAEVTTLPFLWCIRRSEWFAHRLSMMVCWTHEVSLRDKYEQANVR